MEHDPYTNYKDSFLKSGFIGPLPLMAKERALFLARHLMSLPNQQPVWDKALAVTDPLAYRVASDPELVRILRDLIGGDIVLWGASIVVRQPGEVHPWHCDMESSAPDGGFVSVWVGLLNTQKESSLRLIRGSHAYGVTIQELTAREQILRKDRRDEIALRLANSQKAGAEIVQPETGDGEAIIFDGRIWHGSDNSLSNKPRVSLLLQYARADITIRVPDFANLEWPFRFIEDVRPPVLAVAGDSDRNANHVVPPPSLRLERQIRPSAHLIDTNLRCEDGISYAATPCFLGHTDNLDYLECHYSVLMPGNSPHPPHAHLDEEILVVMNGSAELIVPSSTNDANPSTFSVSAGSAIYYPSYQFHTIRNGSSEPVLYAMLRWKSPAISSTKQLTPQLLQSSWVQKKNFSGPISMTTFLEGATAFLGKLHAHITRIQPGGSYEAHRDSHDVAIFLIQGRIGILDQSIVAPAVVFLPAGCLHDMRAAGPESAKYLVWEFHKTVPRLLAEQVYHSGIAFDDQRAAYAEH
jgi:mannose-6-phosphate isomerase-like protein (cupin superfamily)